MLRDFGLGLPGPAPCLTYAFPVERNDEISYRRLQGMQYDPLYENFSLGVLSKLQDDKQIVALRKEFRLFMRADDSICFPWAVLDASHREYECLSTAARASAAALEMRLGLASLVESPLQQGLVIFAFTCCGPCVKLWVTFENNVSFTSSWHFAVLKMFRMAI